MVFDLVIDCSLGKLDVKYWKRVYVIFYNSGYGVEVSVVVFEVFFWWCGGYCG